MKKLKDAAWYAANKNTNIRTLITKWMEAIEDNIPVGAFLDEVEDEIVNNLMTILREDSSPISIPEFNSYGQHIDFDDLTDAELHSRKLAYLDLDLNSLSQANQDCMISVPELVKLLQKHGVDDYPPIFDESEVTSEPEVTRTEQEKASCEERLKSLKSLEAEPTRLMRLMCQAYTELLQAIRINNSLPESDQKKGVDWQVDLLMQAFGLSKKTKGDQQIAKDLRLIANPSNVESEGLPDFMEATFEAHLKRRCSKKWKDIDTQDKLRKKIKAYNKNIKMSMYVASAITNIISTEKEKAGGLKKLRPIKK